MEQYKGVTIIVNEATSFDNEKYTVLSNGSIVYKASFAGNVAYAKSMHEVISLAKKVIDLNL